MSEILNFTLSHHSRILINLSLGGPKMSKSTGLAGLVAGESAICTVGQEGLGLNYRGYSIQDLAGTVVFITTPNWWSLLTTPPREAASVMYFFYLECPFKYQTHP